MEKRRAERIINIYGNNVSCKREKEEREIGKSRSNELSVMLVQGPSGSIPA